MRQRVARWVTAASAAGVLAVVAVAALAAHASGASASGPDYSRPDWGVDFFHAGFRGDNGNGVEATGSGVCVLDFDGDGWEDLFFANGIYRDEALQAERDPRSALYRNLEGRGFALVPDALALSAWAMGCAAGDFDGDGRVDVAVNTFGGAYLFRNLGDGAFENATASSGIERAECDGVVCFGVGAHFFDYDLDADLDLYLLQYVAWDGATNEVVVALPGQCNILWRNEGNGTFTDATEAAGVADCGLNHLGAAIADVDGDGWQDVFLANDATNDTLLMNNGDGTFRDVTEAVGLLDPRAGMGTAWGDYDGDGRYDLVITHWDSEGWALYRQNADGTFTDRAREDGLFDATWDHIGWGAEFVDHDLDGDLDLVMVSGAPNVSASGLAGYGQKNFVLENDGRGALVDATEAVWRPEAVRNSSRGLAVADLDQDGYPDLVVSNNADEHAEVWRSSRGANNWLALRLAGNATVNPDAVGAVVEVEVGGKTLRREVVGGASYLSQSTRDLTFGLGDDVRVDRVTVRWPDGTEQEARDVAANRLVALKAGEEPRLLRERPLVVVPASVTATRGEPLTLAVDVAGASGDAVVRWTVGDRVLEGAEVDVVFATLGAHRVVVRATDASGHWDEADVEVVVVNAPPVPVVTPPPRLVGGRPASFSAAASADPDGSVVRWSWTIEGRAYEGIAVEHAFSRPGPHAVRLEVTDDDGATAAVEVAVVVENGPPVMSLAIPRTASRASPIALDGSATRDLDGEVVRWAWDFGDGSGVACDRGECRSEGAAADVAADAAGALAHHRYASLGERVVTLTVMDDLGAVASASAVVSVLNLPPVPEAVVPASWNVDRPLVLDASRSADADGVVVAWEWSVDGSRPREGAVGSVSFATSGERAVTLTVRDAEGGEASRTWRVAVTDRLDVEVAPPEEAASLGEPHRAAVVARFVDGAPVAGADVSARVALRLAPLGVLGPVTVIEWVVSGSTGEDGRFEFEPPPSWPWLREFLGASAVLVPPTEAEAGGARVAWGDYRAHASVAWRGNSGAAAATFGVAAA